MPNSFLTFLATEAAPELRASLIGQFLLHEMARKGMTARQAAEAAGINVSTLYDYISGRIVSPPSERLDRLAEALAVPKQAFAFLRTHDGEDDEPDETRVTDDCGREPGDPDWGQPCAEARQEGDDEPDDEPPPDEPEEDPAEEDGPPAEPDEERQEDEEPPEEPEEGEETDAQTEVRQAVDSGAIIGQVEGYASLFDKLDRKGTMMAPGAFAASIRRSQSLYFYWEHSHQLPRRGTSTPVGVTTTLVEDSIGLWFRALIANTPKGQELMTLLEVGEVAGKELGSSVAGDPMEWQPGFQGETRVFRPKVDKGPGLILSFDLLEISAAAFPALPGAFTKIARDDLASRLDSATDRIERILGG